MRKEKREAIAEIKNRSIKAYEYYKTVRDSFKVWVIGNEIYSEDASYFGKDDLDVIIRELEECADAMPCYKVA